jgi:hypothetical protein
LVVKKHALLAALAATSLAACASDRSIVDAPADSPSRPRVVGRAPSFLTSDNLGTVAQHGGGVFASSGSPTAYIIYWGSRWSTAPGDIVSTVDDFVHGFGNSNYAHTLNEYQSTAGLTYGAKYFDSSAPMTHQATDSDIMTFLCHAFVHDGVPESGSAIYLVVMDSPAVDELGHHNWSSCDGPPIVYAVVDAGTTGPATPFISGAPQSGAAAGIADVLAHEIIEAFTDYDASSGWYTNSPKPVEIMDKCVNNTGGNTPFQTETLANGVSFKLQGVWSNDAYWRSLGTMNEIGERGCVWTRPLTPAVFGENPVNTGRNCDYSLTIYGGYPPYTIQWSVDGTLNSGQGTMGISMTFDTDGSHLVSALVTDSKGNATYGNLYVTSQTTDPPEITCQAM